MDLLTLGSTALITFGLVWVISLVLEKRNIKLSSENKFILSMVIAIAVSFVPADMGNEIVNRVKDGVGVATGLSGVYQMLSKTAEKVAKG